MKLSDPVLVIAVTIAASLSHLSVRADAPAGNRPNIVLIMADDIGIEGLGCYGGTSYDTSRIDAMAANGLRFTHAYSQPLCTPTRVQLMTGKYNHRNWRSFGILDPGEKTIGHLMSAAGYATAIFGKWQLYSYDPPDFPGAQRRRSAGMHPKDAGFDEYALFHALQTEDKDSRYANPTMLEGKRDSAGTLRTYAGQYGEDIWVDKVIRFLAQHPQQPTFVYYPMALPHWPFVPTPNSPEWNPTQQPQPESLHFAGDMIEYMDVVVGRLLDGLRDNQLQDNTLVLFYSDNGTHLEVASQLNDGRSIQGGKATPLQTGIHVPLIAYWPGRVRQGVTDRLVDASDFWPTLMQLAGGSDLEGRRDGTSFADLLSPQITSASVVPRDSVFVWYDPRPGWDKDRFRRHVFALDHHHKLFRNGQLFRLGPRPLEETLVVTGQETPADQQARQKLKAVIQEAMADVNEPPLVDAFGRPATN